MKKWMNKIGWIINTILGGAIFALGFNLFLDPNGLNAGGISGLAMVIHSLTDFSTVGLITAVINIPLFNTKRR